MAKSTNMRALVFVFRELLGEVLYFPVWWYSHGLAATSRTLLSRWFGFSNRLSIPILARTMGRPMYGDYTRSGRIISFFFRLLLLTTRLIIFGIWTVVLFLSLLVWIVTPIISAAMLVRQIVPL